MNTHQNAPVVKNHAGVIQPNSRIPTLHDTQDLSSDNITNDILELFPPNPTADPVARNYDDNPLPGNYAKRIVSLGFGFTYPILSPATGITPITVMNTLKHAAVVLSRGDRQKQIIRGHLSDYVEFDKFEIETASYDDGTNADDTYVVVMKSTPLARLADSKNPNFVLDPDERFTLQIEFDDVTGIPSDTDWGNATNGVLGVIAFMQVVHRHNP